MARWIKNPSASTQVAKEVQVQSLDGCSGLKDAVLLQPHLRFSPGGSESRIQKFPGQGRKLCHSSDTAGSILNPLSHEGILN